MQIENKNNIPNELINLQVFYALCKNIIYQRPDLYNKALDHLVVITSWINTIDSVDVSLIQSDTYKVINEINGMRYEDIKDIDVNNNLTETNDIISFQMSLDNQCLLLSLITEITIILNNIFYSNNKSYKKFWKENTNLLYYQFIYPLSLQNNSNNFEQYQTSTLDTETYYHKFFEKFQDECLRVGFTIDLYEYFL